jgi:gas vesicle protein
MPEAKTSKGIQISKIAKEVNRQSGEIIDYLKRIGVEVGGIMSKVDESVYNKIPALKADMEDAENISMFMEFKKNTRHRNNGEKRI